MKFRLVSDIHTEFFKDQPFDKFKRHLDYILPPMSDEREQTLVIAGDLGSARGIHAIKLALEHYADRFKDIIYVTGNHEYYGGQLGKTDDEIFDATHHIKNLRFGYNQIPGDGFTIHVHTLWTDFDGGNNISMIRALNGMNDYRVCRNKSGDILHPADTFLEHTLTVKILESTIKPGDVVVTHHLPSFKSCDVAYRSSDMNGAYASDLEHLMLKNKPALWFHGHTHAPCDYKVGNTRIVCNPRGYVGQESNGFKGKLVIEYENTGVNSGGT